MGFTIIMLKINVLHVFLSVVKKKKKGCLRCVKNGCSCYGKMIYCVKVGARMEKHRKRRSKKIVKKK